METTDHVQPREVIPLAHGEFVKAYLDEDSQTFLNVPAAADKAHLDRSTAYSLAQLKKKWIKEFADESPLLKKAEDNIAQILDLPVDDYEHGDKVAKVSMFVAERLGKARYSTRQEVTGEDGAPIVPREEVEMRIINLKRKALEQ